MHLVLERRRDRFITAYTIKFMCMFWIWIIYVYVLDLDDVLDGSKIYIDWDRTSLHLVFAVSRYRHLVA